MADGIERQSQICIVLVGVVAFYLKGFGGISILLAGFGLWALISTRKSRKEN